MKSLLNLPSKEFRDFINRVQDYQQTSKLGCTFWMDQIACFCKVTYTVETIQAKIYPLDSRFDIGGGRGNEIEMNFKKDIHGHTKEEKNLHSM